MRILVTGSTGFIGSHLVRRLAARGAHEIFAAVRPGRRWVAPTGVTAVPWDLRRPEAPPEGPATVDAVVHLAQANVPFPDAAVELYAVNAGSTLVLLDWARRCGARTFVLASSGSVYGFGDHPFPEEDPLRPVDFYGLTKVHAEQLVGAYRQYFATCILRLFAPYGPGQTGRLVPGLINRVREGRPVTLYKGQGSSVKGQGDEMTPEPALSGENRGGDAATGAGGRPRFNPIFIEDVLDVLELLLTRAGRESATLNVGGDEALSIRDMAEIIGQEVGRAPVYEEAAGGPSGDVIGDTRRLFHLCSVLLGPRRLTPFRHGIRTILG